MDASALSALLDAFDLSRVVNYAHVSSLTILGYNIIITHDLEVKHIWRSRWSIPKVLYLIARYYALFHLALTLAVSITPGINVKLCVISALPKCCYKYLQMRRVLSNQWLILANITDALLIMRLRCMYANNKSVTRVLGGLFIVQALIEGIVVGFSTSSSNAVSPPPWLSAWPGCFYTNPPPRYALAAWVPSLLFATTLFGMTLHKLWEFHREGVNTGGLFVIFARDGAMFFAMIFALELLNTIVTAVVTNGRLLEIGVPWIIAVYGVVSSRLILNLREYNADVRQLTLPGPNKTTAVDLEFIYSGSTTTPTCQACENS